MGIFVLAVPANYGFGKDYTPFVNPFIGTYGAGHTFPGDDIGLVSGFKVRVDYFGNQIQGAEGLGAVEIG
ncbi:hypothetical protein MLD52_10345 [Puniceicoccaceae bacterium K14]|nr:hypothetical protein [Puniceicoccaceae bacterium K14]